MNNNRPQVAPEAGTDTTTAPQLATPGRAGSRLAILTVLAALAGSAGCATTAPKGTDVAAERTRETAKLTGNDLDKLTTNALDDREAAKLTELLKGYYDGLVSANDPVSKAKLQLLQAQLRTQFGLDLSDDGAIDKLRERVTNLTSASQEGVAGNEVAAKNLAELKAKIAEVIGIDLGIEGDLKRVTDYLKDLQTKAAAGDEAAQTTLEKLQGLVNMLENPNSAVDAGSGAETITLKAGRRGGYTVEGAKNPEEWNVEKGILYKNGKAVLRLPKMRNGQCITVNTVKHTYGRTSCDK